jgi:bacteriorhodopsin
MTEYLVPDLAQYHLGLVALSFTAGAMLLVGALLWLLRPTIDAAYRWPMTLMNLVVLIAGVYYVMLHGVWEKAFAFVNGQFASSGAPFSESLRYSDWLLTVPLMLSATLLTLDVGKSKLTSLVARVAGASVLMLVLGFTGEMQSDSGLRLAWGLLSLAPLAYMISVMWLEVGSVLRLESARVRTLFIRTRLVLFSSWSFYPVMFFIPLLGVNLGNVAGFVQVAYSLADVVAKGLFAFMLYFVVQQKTSELQAHRAKVAEVEQDGASAYARY